MGRVIVRTPNAFLMDEPLSNLDAKLRVQMRTEVSRLQKRLGTTTVYVTHDQVEAMTLGDRVAVMRGGVIQQVGPPEELYDRPANLFVAGFIGSPAMNFLPATVKGGTLQLAARRPAAAGRAPAAGFESDGGGERRVSSSASGRSTSRTPPSSATSVTRAPSSSANVDLLESLGSDKYAYFTVKSERAHPPSISRSWPRTPGASRWRREDGVQVTARLDAASDAKEDQELEFWLDLRRVHVFDPGVGREPDRGYGRGRRRGRPSGRRARQAPGSRAPGRGGQAARTEPAPVVPPRQPAPDA